MVRDASLSHSLVFNVTVGYTRAYIVYALNLTEFVLKFSQTFSRGMFITSDFRLLKICLKCSVDLLVVYRPKP